MSLLVVLGTFAPLVSAAEGESIVLSPVSKKYDIKAGDSFRDKLIIINDGTVGYSFKVYASPYSVSSGNYSADYDKQTENSDAYQWVQFEKKEYHLEPGQNTEVPYTITVPKDAAPGGHYGVIFAETMIEGGGNVVRQKRVGSIMYSSVDGEIILRGKQIDSRIDAVQLNTPLHSSMTVENTGNTHFTAKATMRVKNVFDGSEMYAGSKEYIILPKTTRDLHLEWTGGPGLGWFTVVTESEILDKKATNEQLVFVAPAWFLIVAAVVIVGAVFWFIRRRR